MDTVKRVAKNTTALFLADAIKGLLYFILVIYMARYLGVADFGKYSFAINMTLLAGIIPDMGLGLYYIREVARDRRLASKYMGNFITLRVLFSLLTFGLIFAVMAVLNYPADTTLAVYGMAIYMILISFTELFKSVFHAFERMEYDGIVKVAERGFLFAAGMAVLFAGMGLLGIVSVSVIAAFLSLILSAALMSWKFIRPSLSFDWKLCKESIKQAFPFAIATVFALVYFGIDSVMLFIMVGDVPVGIYNAAYNLILGLTIIPAAFTSAIYPLLSRYFKESKESLRLLYNKSLKYLIMLAIPVGIGTTIISPQIIGFLYGPEYSGSVIALQLLVWGGAAWFVSFGVNTALKSVNRQRTLAWIAGAAVILNVSLNLFLIPQYSYIGAGIATIITEFFVLLAGLLKIRDSLPLRGASSTVAKSLLSGVVMSLALYCLSGLHVLLLVAISIALYFPVMFLLRGLGKDDIMLFKKLF